MRTPICILVLSIVPALLAWAIFGTVHTPDTQGYVDYAAQIVAHAVPRGAALLASAPSPVSLFRAPGYPLILAALHGWAGGVIVLQMAANAGLAVLAYRAALRLSARPGLAVAAALLPAIGFSVVVQICVLSDALNAALVAGAALVLAGGRDWRAGLAAGLMLAGAVTLREATVYLALFYVPLALSGRRPVHCAVLALSLPVLAAAGLMAWNTARIGTPVLTTSRQTVMVQAVLPLLAAGLPVYDGADAFDRTARATLGAGDYAAIDTLHARLFYHAHMTAPEIAATATARYWRAWRRFPGAMAGATLNNLRVQFFWMPFQPIDTAGALAVYARWRRPRFDRLNILWRGRSAGDLGWIAALLVTRAVGLAISVAALLAPWRRSGEARCWGLVCVCAGFFAVYLPVHIETRYLVPVVPLACVLAACGLTRLPPAPRRAAR